MADASSPDINLGGKTNLSRRDFLKLAAVGVGFIVAGPKLVEFGNNLEKEAVLMGARQFLIKNEDIPPEIKDIPVANEHFMFADEVLEKALSQYEEWALKENLPPPFFRKSESYFDYKDSDFLAGLAQSGSQEYLLFIKNLFDRNMPDSDKCGFYNKYFKLRERFFKNIRHNFDPYLNEKFKSSPMTFSGLNIQGINSLLANNPGSSILNRVSLQIGMIDPNSAYDEQSAVMTLHQEINSIWKWVDDFVGEKKNPMSMDVFLAGLIYRNKGDISGSLWDAVLLSKLIRNNPDTFALNDLYGLESTVDGIRKNVDTFLNRLQDCFAPRLSANWINKNSRNKDLFAYDYKKDFKDKDYKPFDRYSAVGDIYHGLNIMAFASVTTPELLQAMVILQNSYIITQSLKFNPDMGQEKITADLLVAYRAPEVRKILDKYSV